MLVVNLQAEEKGGGKGEVSRKGLSVVIEMGCFHLVKTPGKNENVSSSEIDSL